MTICQCLTKEGKQCSNQASTKALNNPNYCWQHQNCKTLPIKKQSPPKQPSLIPKQSQTKDQSSLIPQQSPIPNNYVPPKKLNFFLVKDINLSGGGNWDLKEIIQNMDTTKMKYIKTDDNQYIFEFDKKLIGFGVFTAVFRLTNIKSPDLSISDLSIPDLSIPKQDLILRAVNAGIDGYINKWNEDIEILPLNIPMVYLYGRIYTKKAKPKDIYSFDKLISNYSIVKNIMIQPKL